jgi:hypothetical protein
MRRCVLLFNTWAEPPLTPAPNQPLTDRELVAALAAPEEEFSCLPRAAWAEVPVTAAADSGAKGALDHSTQGEGTRAQSLLGHGTLGPLVSLSVPLLGDACRRATASAEVAAVGSEPALREAMAGTHEPTLVRLF